MLFCETSMYLFDIIVFHFVILSLWPLHLSEIVVVVHSTRVWFVLNLVLHSLCRWCRISHFICIIVEDSKKNEKGTLEYIGGQMDCWEATDPNHVQL